MTDASASSIADRLHRFVAAQLPDVADLHLHGLHRTSAGLSRENWVFDASWLEHGTVVEESLILRRDPEGSVLRTERRVEFAVLRALERSDVPAPRVRWFDEHGATLGRARSERRPVPDRSWWRRVIWLVLRGRS